MKPTIIWTIDDDLIYRIIISKTITNSNLFAEQQNFINAKEALKLLKNNLNRSEVLPDIILLDLNMPCMDGWEFVEEIGLIKTQLSKNMQLYIASSSISNEDQKKSKKYPEIAGFLSKPITIQDLKNITSTSWNALSPPNFVPYE